MDWIFKFMAGALVGLIAVVAVGLPVVHYTENGGVRVFGADLAAAVLGEQFRPSGAEAPAEPEVARMMSEPAAQVAAIPRVRPLPQLPNEAGLGGVLNPEDLKRLMSASGGVQMPSVQQRPGETTEQMLGRQVIALESMAAQLQALDGSGLMGGLATSTCLAASPERRHASDRLDDLTRCAAEMGAAASSLPGAPAFDGQALIDSGTHLVMPGEFQVQAKRDCWGEAPADLSPRDRALRNQMCDRMMKQQ